jgi:O-antigen ligase
MSLGDKLQRMISSLLVWLVTILPFVFFWVNDELFEFNKMMVVYGFAVVIVGLYGARMVVEKRLIWKKTIFDWPLGLFLLSQIIATIFSWHPRTSWLGYYTRLNGGLLSTLSYIGLYCAYVNNVGEKGRGRMLWRGFLSSIIVSLYAIGEHYGHSFSCLIIKGNFNVGCWVQDVQERVFATFGQPNWLAAYNLMIISLGTALMLPGSLKLVKEKWKQNEKGWWLGLIATATYLNFVALIFTKSRSGIIAFFVSLVATLALVFYSWWRTKQWTWAWRCENYRALALILLGFLVPCLIWGTQYTPSLEQLVRKVRARESDLYTPIAYNIPDYLKNIDTTVTDSGDIRKVVWRGALDIWRRYPFFGTGVETFAYSYYQYRPQEHNWTSEWDFLYNKAHNELLNMAANSGTFGLMTYLSIFLVLGWCLLKQVHHIKEPAKVGREVYPLIGVASGVLAVSISHFFGFSTVTVQVLLFLFLAIFAQVYGQLQPVVMEDSRLKSRWQKVGVGLIGGLMVFGVMEVVTTWRADYFYATCKNNLGKSNTKNLQETLKTCDQATKLRPKEALYQIELGDYYAQLANSLNQQEGQKEQATKLMEMAVNLSENGYKLNPVNLNFYKTRFRTYANLLTINPNYIFIAENILLEAMKRSPTDAKLTYYYASLLPALGRESEQTEWLEKTVNLRPLYGEARLALARKLREDGQWREALAHYHFYLDYNDQNNAEAKGAVASMSAMIAREE